MQINIDPSSALIVNTKATRSQRAAASLASPPKNTQRSDDGLLLSKNDLQLREGIIHNLVVKEGSVPFEGPVAIWTRMQDSFANALDRTETKKDSEFEYENVVEEGGYMKEPL